MFFAYNSCPYYILTFRLHFCSIYTSAEGNRKLEIPIANGQIVSWFQFYKNYVSQNRPVLLEKAFRDNRAYNLWSSDYFYYNFGSPWTFQQTEDDHQNTSLRKIKEKSKNQKQSKKIKKSKNQRKIKNQRNQRRNVCDYPKSFVALFSKRCQKVQVFRLRYSRYGKTELAI